MGTFVGMLFHNPAINLIQPKIYSHVTSGSRGRADAVLHAHDVTSGRNIVTSVLKASHWISRAAYRPMASTNTLPRVLGSMIRVACAHLKHHVTGFVNPSAQTPNALLIGDNSDLSVPVWQAYKTIRASLANLLLSGVIRL